MGTSFSIKQNDTAPSLQVALFQGDGTPQDLTGAIVTFSMQRQGYVTTMTIIDAACSLVGSPTAGTVQYAWQTSDTVTPGAYTGEFHVRLQDGRTITFPTSGALTIYILAVLP